MPRCRQSNAEIVRRERRETGTARGIYRDFANVFSGETPNRHNVCRGPAVSSGALTFDHDAIVSSSLEDSVNCSGCGGLQVRPCRDLAVLQVAPQRDGQAPGQGYDSHTPHASARSREAPVEPECQLAVGLQAQPTPCLFHQQRSYSPVARLADALLAFDAAARVRRRHQPQAARQLASVGEVPPADCWRCERTTARSMRAKLKVARSPLEP